MRVILAACLAFGLSGCVLSKNPKTVAAVPATPKPAPAPPAAPPTPPEPLSIHQTNVELPAAQPISNDALSSMQAPEETLNPTPPSHKERNGKGRGGGTSAASGTKPDAPRVDAPKPEA